MFKKGKNIGAKVRHCHVGNNFTHYTFVHYSIFNRLLNLKDNADMD